MSFFNDGNIRDIRIGSEIMEGAKRFKSPFNPDQRMDNRYIDKSVKIEFAAKHNDCLWSRDAGNSTGIPNQETPTGRLAAAALTAFNLDGIRFRDGEPDFRRCSLATAQIEVTGNYYEDKKRACAEIARQWDVERPKPDGTKYTAQEVKDWARENRLELHHDSDMKTVRYVPADIHQYYKHQGGVAEIKFRNEIRNGSRFDD